MFYLILQFTVTKSDFSTKSDPFGKKLFELILNFDQSDVENEVDVGSIVFKSSLEFRFA